MKNSLLWPIFACMQIPTFCEKLEYEWTLTTAEQRESYLLTAPVFICNSTGQPPLTPPKNVTLTD